MATFKITAGRVGLISMEGLWSTPNCVDWKSYDSHYFAAALSIENAETRMTTTVQFFRVDYDEDGVSTEVPIGDGEYKSEGPLVPGLDFLAGVIIDPAPLDFVIPEAPGIYDQPPYRYLAKFRVRTGSEEIQEDSLDFYFNFGSIGEFEGDDLGTSPTLLARAISLSELGYEKSGIEFDASWPELVINLDVQPYRYSANDGSLVTAAARIVDGTGKEVTFGRQQATFSKNLATIELFSTNLPVRDFGANPFLEVSLEHDGRTGIVYKRLKYEPKATVETAFLCEDLEVSQGGSAFGSTIDATKTGGVIARLPVTFRGVKGVGKDVIVCVYGRGINLATQFFSFQHLEIDPSAAKTFNLTWNFSSDVIAQLDSSIRQVLFDAYISYSVGTLRFEKWYTAGIVNVRRASFTSSVVSDGFQLKFDNIYSPSPGPAPVDPKKLSGSHWVSKFPTSTSLSSLASPFKENVTRFIDCLRDNGATVVVSATRRPKERAYLMHYSFRIARDSLASTSVPTMTGVDIEWTHPSQSKTMEAAEAMVRGYDIVYEPALDSKHVDGLAIDMTISGLPRVLKWKENGKDVAEDIGTDSSGASNRLLHKVAWKYFQVRKLNSDPPHWFG